MPKPESRVQLTRNVATFPLLAMIFGLFLACTDSEPNEAGETTPAPAAKISLELFDETLALEDGGTLAYQRGLATVPVSRANPGGKTLEVEFFRFHRDASASPDTPPIVLLHGGPGFAGLGPRLENPGYFEARLSRYTPISDVIVPGQRGFGGSFDTPCPPLPEATAELALNLDTRLERLLEGSRSCRESWESKGLDLEGFTITEAAADVADIVELLGYEKVQLRGISFGSHWGMAVLRYHPERIARATLAALEGPDHTFDVPTEILATLQRIAASAEASEELAHRIPEGGLLKAFEALVARADKEPIEVDVEHPGTGEPVTVKLSGADLKLVFAGLRRFTTFRHRATNWPLAVLEMLEGDLQEAAEAHLYNLLSPGLENAAYFQYECGSGMSPARQERLQADPATALLGETWMPKYGLCDVWTADLGEDFRGAFQSSIPTVLVQGNWDTASPYEHSPEFRSFFENHHFVHVEGGSHGAIREAIEQVPGMQDAMDHWLATGEFEQIPERVELPPMRWKSDWES